MENNKKTTLTDKQQQRLAEREEMRQMLLNLPEIESAQRGTDAALDRRNEIKFLINNHEYTLGDVLQFQDDIRKEIQICKSQFPESFYDQLRRLTGYPKPEGHPQFRPHAFAKYTNDLIYSRFGKEVLPTLQTLNPFIGWGIRINMHYHWLTDSGREKLQKYIAEATDMMVQSKSWLEFREAYATKHGLPFQPELPL